VSWHGHIKGASDGAGLHLSDTRSVAVGSSSRRCLPRRRASPFQFLITDCGELSIGWISNAPYINVTTGEDDSDIIARLRTVYQKGHVTVVVAPAAASDCSYCLWCFWW